MTLELMAHTVESNPLGKPDFSCAVVRPEVPLVAPSVRVETH